MASRAACRECGGRGPVERHSSVDVLVWVDGLEFKGAFSPDPVRCSAFSHDGVTVAFTHGLAFVVLAFIFLDKGFCAVALFMLGQDFAACGPDLTGYQVVCNDEVAGQWTAIIWVDDFCAPDDLIFDVDAHGFDLSDALLLCFALLCCCAVVLCAVIVSWKPKTRNVVKRGFYKKTGQMNFRIFHV